MDEKQNTPEGLNTEKEQQPSEGSPAAENPNDNKIPAEPAPPPQSEIPVIPVPTPSTANPIVEPQPPVMEVHHPHRVHHFKKWNDYLFDFFMLFLAISAGFYLENYRESRSEKERAVQYIHSFTEDVKTDTAQLTRLIEELGRKDKGIDSLLNTLKTPSVIANSNPIFRLYANMGFSGFIYTDRTMQQLKSTGGMRLIRDANTSDSIIAYDAYVRTLISSDNLLTEIITSVYYYTSSVLDFSEVKGWQEGVSFKNLEVPSKPIPLLTTSPIKVKEYYNRIGDYKRFAAGFRQALIKLKERGASLIGFLESKYPSK